MALKKLPLGVEDFRDFSEKDCYYVDKTGMIKELLANVGQVNLFARPRRFGKSLTMSKPCHLKWKNVAADHYLIYEIVDRNGLSDRAVCKPYDGDMVRHIIYSCTGH